MLYTFPCGTVATVIEDYDRPYSDPISVRAGDVVVLDLEHSKSTDIMGWIWCTGPDGRAGWTPKYWIGTSTTGERRVLRDFSALEHCARKGDVAELHLAESGFVWATINGKTAWIPDAVLELRA